MASLKLSDIFYFSSVKDLTSQPHWLSFDQYIDTDLYKMSAFFCDRLLLPDLWKVVLNIVHVFGIFSVLFFAVLIGKWNNLSSKNYM